MMSRHLALVLCLVVLLPVPPSLLAQTSEPDRPTGFDDSVVAQPVASERVQLARGTPDYPVTPGDEYLLSFERGGRAFSVPLIIPATGIADFGAIGSVDTAGLTLQQFRDAASALVQRAYPGTFPQLRLIAVGTFEITVSGEIPETVIREGWGLTRLSGVLADVETRHASSRQISVTGANGSSVVYDLQRALRLGETDQDPFIRPGDRIRLTARGPAVSVRGQVRFPGTYELLPGDRLATVLERYAGGLTPVADISTVRIVSYVGVTDQIAASVTWDLTSADPARIALADRDEILVPSRTDFLPVVFFEGAVDAGPAAENEAMLRTSGSVADQLRFQFHPGETVADAARAIRNRFLTTADLSGAHLERAAGGEIIPVDLAVYLYSEDLPDAVPLERNDRIVVPFRQYFVTVSGAVANPGQYPYIPGRGYEYYLGLAGGTDPQRHIGNNPRITTVENERKRDDAVIEPEDDIFFASTNPLYHLSPIVSLAATILSTVAIVLSLTP